MGIETIGFDNDVYVFNVAGTIIEHDDKRVATDTILKSSHLSLVEVPGAVVVQDQTLLHCCANKQEFIALMHGSLLANVANVATSKKEVIMEYDNVVVHPDIIEANCVEVESLVYHEVTSTAVTSDVPVSTSCVPVGSDDSNIPTGVVSPPNLMDISGMKLLGYAMVISDVTPQDSKDIEAPLCFNADGLTCAPAIAQYRKTNRVVASMSCSFSAVCGSSESTSSSFRGLCGAMTYVVISCISNNMGLKAGYATILDTEGTLLGLALVSEFSTAFLLHILSSNGGTHKQVCN